MTNTLETPPSPDLPRTFRGRADMNPVLITNATVPHAAGHRIQPDDLLPQHQATDLSDVLPLLATPLRRVAR